MNALLALNALERVQDQERRRKIYSPRINQFLLRDLEFKRRYRFNKETVREIIKLVADELVVDTRGAGISPELQVLIAIRCWGRREAQDDAGECHGVSQPSVSRICAKVARSIAAKAPLYIKMPASLPEEQAVMAKFQSMSNFPDVIGAIGCTHIKIKRRGEQTQFPINRKGQYTLNVQVVCDAELKIMDIETKWRGSAHGSHIFSESSLKQRFDDGQLRGRLLGDSGFPLLPYLFTPVLHPHSEQEECYNEAQIRTHKTVERCFELWKQRFPCLLWGLTFKFQNCKMVITALAVLHNIALDMNDSDILPDDESYAKIQENDDEHDGLHQVHHEMGIGQPNTLLQTFIQQNF